MHDLDASLDKYLSHLASSPLSCGEATRHIREMQEEAARAQALLDLEMRWIRRLEIPRHLSESEHILESHRQVLESSKRWARASNIVQSELPRRGWYLSGREPCRLTEELAHLAEAKDWKAIDDIMVAQACRLQLKVDLFTRWLAEKGVAECCIKRVHVFLEARQAGDHEVATLVGVPLIDELCRYLYDGRDFTTKRTKQPKPQISCKTPRKSRSLGLYYSGFVEEFGLIHKDVDTARLGDEDYFNRAAIVHGQMRRAYGPKDSAKVFMVLMFLVLARDESAETPDLPQSKRGRESAGQSRQGVADERAVRERASDPSRP